VPRSFYTYCIYETPFVVVLMGCNAQYRPIFVKYENFSMLSSVIIEPPAKVPNELLHLQLKWGVPFGAAAKRLDCWPVIIGD